jgi:hypothetical protein
MKAEAEVLRSPGNGYGRGRIRSHRKPATQRKPLPGMGAQRVASKKQCFYTAVKGRNRVLYGSV